MSKLRYSVTVQFDVDAGDAQTLKEKMDVCEVAGTITSVKAKSAGKGKKAE